MRLKTKFQDEDFDLGEVVEANIYHGGNGGVKVIAEPTKGGMITFYFKTLKGLNEMFEDYEEPKEWWYIDIHGPHKVTNNDEYLPEEKEYQCDTGWVALYNDGSGKVDYYNVYISINPLKVEKLDGSN